MNNRNDEASAERMQKRLEAGIMSKHFPEVEGIVVSMIYNQKGTARPIHRTVNFSSDSYAFFDIDCLSKDCDNGGFDLTNVIHEMIKDRTGSAKGGLGCKNSDARTDHSSIEYNIKIKFS